MTISHEEWMESVTRRAQEEKDALEGAVAGVMKQFPQFSEPEYDQDVETGQMTVRFVYEA